jgi:hypothetical protein
MIPGDDRFKDTVFGPRDLVEAGPEFADALVVVGVNAGRSPSEDAGQKAVVLDMKTVLGSGDGIVTVVIEPPRTVCEVLVERPTEVDVQYLHTMTNGQDRDVSLECGIQQV